MIQRLSKLIEVRKLIALSITALFIALALMGKIDMKLVEYVVTTVIAFYFAKSTALDAPNSRDN
ncbi:hypothetical protein SDC9_139086 [bioreactor metagenome]|uniref:Uncharacterized protein n=1 Tax=bioreactor metagenome TaxID=1076179 RepID=A0A645DUC1_9ZZZZ